LRGCVVAWGVRARAHACVHACVGVHDALGVGLASSAPRLGTPGAVGPALVRSPALVWVKRPDKLVAARVLHARARRTRSWPCQQPGTRTARDNKAAACARTHGHGSQWGSTPAGGARPPLQGSMPRTRRHRATHLRAARTFFGSQSLLSAETTATTAAASAQRARTRASCTIRDAREGGGQRHSGVRAPSTAGTRQHGAAPRGGALRRTRRPSPAPQPHTAPPCRMRWRCAWSGSAPRPRSPSSRTTAGSPCWTTR